RWLFSSLESRELANFINVISNEFDYFYVDTAPKDLENPEPAAIIDKAQNEMKVCVDKNLKVSLRREKEPLWKKPATLHDYLQEMHGRIQGVYDDVYDEEWEHFRNRLTVLFTEAAKAKHVTELWIGDMGYRAEMTAPYQEGMTYRERFRGILKEFRDAMSQLKQSYGCILRIENEIDKIVPIRSEIEMELDEISRIADTSMQNDAAGRKACCTEVTKLRTEFEQLFNDRYNKGLAIQHHAEFIDVCDCPQHTEEVIGNLKAWKKMTVEIPQEAVIKLGLMSWKQFAIVASNSKVIQARRKLWKAYRDEEISTDDFNEILRQYLQQLEEKINKRGKSDWKVKGGSWDYYYTNIYDLHDDFFKNRQPSFIGGGSFIEGKEANEVCLYRECKEGRCLHRIRIEHAENPEEDKNFDTILAPVQNVFNGKR
ncbi:MAG: hypothetical protein LUD69_08985, partial [Oscillospiraceae bacterium]|nr:hypothetical protein [Oscillospiraceae bacterium]